MVLFPTSYNWYLRREDIETRDNIVRLRCLFEEIIANRQQAMKRPDYVDRGDLVSILL
jgi:cytochrome P450